jgi:hypothetical protein
MTQGKTKSNGSSGESLANRAAQNQRSPLSHFFRMVEMKQMTPFAHPENVVSDSEDEDTTWKTRKALIPQTGTLLIRHLGHALRKLTRFRPIGNAVPQLGQACLIVKGKAGKDEGQVGIVSDTTTAMVWVTYVQEKTGRRIACLKRPSSLVMLDPGVVAKQDKNGTLWIMPVEEVASHST